MRHLGPYPKNRNFLMCKTQTTIKLCTCNQVLEGKNKTWRLVRGNSYSQVVGEFLPPKTQYVEFKLGIFLQQKILIDLNNAEVFDFDYKKEDGDVLIIFLNNQEYHYIVKAGRFYIEDASKQTTVGVTSNSGEIRLNQQA